MPTGTYELLDGEGRARGVEEFRCAPGPIGWRSYSSVTLDGQAARVDLSVDARWEPVRVRIENPAHHLLLSQSPAGATFMLDDATEQIARAPVVSFPSPAFLVAAVRALPEGGATPALLIDAATLQPAPATLSFELLDAEQDVETSVGTFTAARWSVSGREFFVAGDVLVAGPGLRLVAYDRGAAGPVPRS